MSDSRRLKDLRVEHQSETLYEWPAPGGAVWHVTLAWSEGGGRSEPVALLLEPPAGADLTAETVRRVPIGKIITESRSGQFAKAKRRVASKSTPDWLRIRAAQDLGRFGPKRRELTDEVLREVAEVYRSAWRGFYVNDLGRHLPPRQAVAFHFKRAESTASAWIKAARVAGHLAAAQPGKAQP